MNARRIDETIILNKLREARDTMFQPTDAQIVTKAHIALASRGILRDAVQRWDATRTRTRFAIRRALAPMLVARAASARLLAAAHAVNAEAGDPLLPREVHAEVVREVYWAARRLGRVGVAS
jgi:hypothetical protein